MKTILEKTSNGKSVRIVLDDQNEIRAFVDGVEVGSGYPVVIEPVTVSGTLRTHRIGKLGITREDALDVIHTVEKSQIQPTLSPLEHIMNRYEDLKEKVSTAHARWEDEFSRGMETSRFSSVLQDLSREEETARETLNSFLRDHPEIEEELNRRRGIAEKEAWAWTH
jgi:hypothetical protein